MKDAMKETKSFLNQIRKIDVLIKHKQDEIEQLRSLAESTSISLGERVQSSGSKQRMADTVDRYVEMEKEVTADIERLIKAKREVLEVIEQLPLDQYDLLYQVYVKGEQLKSYKTDKSESWVRSMHGIALLGVRDILRDRKKT